MSTAAERLDRILYILPAAHRPGGAQLAELAAALGVSIETVLADIETVTAREYYHPAGSSDSMCIRIEGDCVLLEGPAEFERPVRLNAREALAVHLGLHTLAAECEAEQRARLLALATRIAAELRAPDFDEVPQVRSARTDYSVLGEPTVFGADIQELRPSEVEYEPDVERELLLGLGDDVLRGILSDAIAEARVVELLYLKAGAAEPEPRRLAPQRLAYADGVWYVLGQDLDRRHPRIFRLDRVLDATLGEPAGEIAHDRDWIARVAERGSAPYFAEAEEQVVVRYAPAIARWIAERADVTHDPDGSVLVRHHVADQRWIVRHVLQFAGAAWIEEPASLREVVARRALELSA